MSWADIGLFSIGFVGVQLLWHITPLVKVRIRAYRADKALQAHLDEAERIRAEWRNSKYKRRGTP